MSEECFSKRCKTNGHVRAKKKPRPRRWRIWEGEEAEEYEDDEEDEDYEEDKEDIWSWVVYTTTVKNKGKATERQHKNNWPSD